MSKSNLVKDNATRGALKDIERTIDRIGKIKQLPSTASLKEVIATINKITDSLKRR